MLLKLEDVLGQPVRIVVPISGGKDSQACLKLALEHAQADQVLGLFCDTKFEHPWTYQHVESLPERYGVRIVRVNNGDVEQQVARHKTFPTGTVRFCTDNLKLVPAKHAYRSLAEAAGGFEVWLGMRSQESVDRAARYARTISDETYAPHEIFPSKFPKRLETLGVRFRLPILDWHTEDVIAYVGHDELNPLYRHGFDRVGCFPCLAGGDRAKIRAFEFDGFGKDQWERVQILEEQIGESVMTAKIGERWKQRQMHWEDEEDSGECGSGCGFCSI